MHRNPEFAKAHHPELLLNAVLHQRQNAISAMPGFMSDVKAGVLMPPRLLLGGLFDEPSAKADDAAVGGANGAAASSGAGGGGARHLVKFEPLPSSAVGHARTVLCCAAAGAAKALEPADEGAAPSVPALVAVLSAEPIRGRTRLWAAYSTDAATEAGRRAMKALPQFAELVEAPEGTRDMLYPPREREPAPPALTDEELLQQVEWCDELIGALEARLQVKSLAEHISAEAASLPTLTPSEQLELRLLYLRRVHHFDALGGGAFPTHSALLTTCGEAHLAASSIVHAAQRELVATPARYSYTRAATDAQATYLRALEKLDQQFITRIHDAGEAFYNANCIEIEPEKFRCPLSGKLFKEAKFVRKHIDNKWAPALREAKRAALEPKYEQYFLAGATRVSAMPRLPPRPAANSGGGRGGGISPRGGGKGFGKGKGYGDGGKGYGKGDGKGYGKGFGGDFTPPPLREGPPPPPPEGAEQIGRSMVAYKDLDAPDDDELFS